MGGPRSAASTSTLYRPGSSADQWQVRLNELRQGSLLGWLFATARHRLCAIAERLGLKRVPDLHGCPAS
jgi:hypothetical protein